MYIRKETYEIKEFLDKVELHHTKSDIVILDGDPIKLGSDRYKTFKVYGVDCVHCDAKGIYFAKERTATKKPPIYETWHLNLYAERSDGKIVLMTKDHIKPKVEGGLDHIDNYQPMCEICNSKKGRKWMNQ